MVADIYSNKFYTTRSKPAWHGINILNDPAIEDKPRTAREVLALVGEPMYDMLPLQYQWGGQAYTSDHSAIVRWPTGAETTPQLMGVVSEDYVPIYPGAAAALWDAKVGITVETFGMLANGAKTFISGVLPKIDIKGEEVQTYLILYSPLNGVDAATGLVAATRVVCQNTLHMAMHEGKSSFRVRHSKGAATRLGNWLQDIYQSALFNVQVMKEAYTLLANTPVSTPEVKWITEQVYKLPAEPQPNDALKTAWEDRMQQYEYRCDWVERARAEVLSLYNGKGTGLQNPAISGTAWCAFNAFSEFSTYRRGTADSMAHNVLVGDRAREIKKAYSHLIKLAN